MVIVSTRRYGTHRITTVPTKPGTPITTGKNPITTQVTLKPTTAKVSTTRVGARNTPIIKRTVQQTQKMRSQMISQMPRNPPPPIKPQIPGQKTIIKTSKISGPRSNHRQHKLNPQINTVGSLLKNFGNTQMAHAMGPNDGNIINGTIINGTDINVTNINGTDINRKNKTGWWSNYNNKLLIDATGDDPPPPPKIDTPIGSGVGSGANLIIDTNLDPFKTNQINDIRMDKERLEKIYKQQRENNKKNPPDRHTYIQNFGDLEKNDFKSFNRKILPLAENFLSGYNTGKKVDKEFTAWVMNKDTNKLEAKTVTRKVYKSFLDGYNTNKKVDKKDQQLDNVMNLANPKISNNFDLYERMYTDRLPRQNDAWYI